MFYILILAAKVVCQTAKSCQYVKKNAKKYALLPYFGENLSKLFIRVNQGADDEAAESGIGIRVRIGITVGFLAVVCVFLFPLSTEFGGVHDDRGLLDCLCERRNSLLARGRKRTFIRMLDYISMRTTVAGTHDNLIGGTEFARHGVEGMRESGSSHI